MKTSKILKAINEMSENQLIDLNNRYAQSINASDNEVYNNDDDFFETWGAKATEVLRAAHFGDYNWSHNYVKFNRYYSEPSECIVDFDEYIYSLLLLSANDTQKEALKTVYENTVV